MLQRLAHNLPLLCLLIGSGFALFATTEAMHELKARRAYADAVREVEVVAPSALPLQTQESVDLAMVMYSIEQQPFMSGPDFDLQLPDRGLTTGGVILPQKRVSVGPSAFSSWSVLGSTLAHEIEVHVRQSFLKVVITDKVAQWSVDARLLAARFFPAVRPDSREIFENEGTWSAERDAYMHEIRNAKRFGLTQDDIRSIRRVMDYYYPMPQKSEKSGLSAVSEHTAGDASDNPFRALGL